MRELLILAILPATQTAAQCTLFDQSGCGRLYTAPVPAAASWLSTAPQVFGSSIQPFMGMLLNNAGVGTRDVNIWGTPFACAPSYKAYAAAFSPAISVTCDCAGGATLAKGAAPPPASGPHCNSLSRYDGMFQFAAAKGITLRTGWLPGGDEIEACGLTPASAGGVFTEARFEACMIPFFQAGMKRYGSAITRDHHPVGHGFRPHRSAGHHRATLIGRAGRDRSALNHNRRRRSPGIRCGPDARFRRLISNRGPGPRDLAGWRSAHNRPGSRRPIPGGSADRPALTRTHLS
jgi:hypothetical protein